MIIRSFQEDDFEKLKLIHEKFYKDEFSFSDFCHAFVNFFVVVGDDEIICAGGVRTITESVIMTNKDVSPRVRQLALKQMLQAQLFTCSRMGYHQLHAFIQDEGWKRHLLKNGFKECKGRAIFIEVD